MNILLAPDKFKGSLSSHRFCEIVQEELALLHKDFIVDSCPIADGGDGSLDILKSYLSLDRVEVSTVDPLGREISTNYYMNDSEAYIELASASGLVLLQDGERNPMNTSTYGTGLMINDAIEKGCQTVHLFLGGSATNDGGIGIAKAMGIRFLDHKGQEVTPVGSSMTQICKIEKVQVSSVKLILYCDVKNPPIGPRGASRSYARQKGASQEDINHLEKGIRNLCQVIQEKTGKDLSTLEGGGAVGGVPVSLVALLDTEIRSGILSISTMVNLEERVKKADMVITGEGKLDATSLEGKVISHVAMLCKKHQKRLVAIVGKCDLGEDTVSSLAIESTRTLVDVAIDEKDAIDHPEKHLGKIVKDLF